MTFSDPIPNMADMQTAWVEEVKTKLFPKEPKNNS